MLLLDSEAISAIAHGPAARRDRVRALIAVMHARNKPIATVAAVLAEVVRGRPADAGVFAGLRRERVEVCQYSTSTYELDGTSFVWDEDKACANVAKHGESFEAASRNDEARCAAIGFDEHARLLYVVHVEVEDEHLRIVSARPATREERQRYDQ